MYSGGKQVGNCPPDFPLLGPVFPSLKSAGTIDLLGFSPVWRHPADLRYVGNRKDKIAREMDEGRDTPEMSHFPLIDALLLVCGDL